MILLRLYILVTRIFRDIKNIYRKIYQPYTSLKTFMLRMTNYRFKCHHLNVGEQYHYTCNIEYTHVDFNQL